MTTHNDRIKELASVSLDDDQTIGATINWYITHRPVPVPLLQEAFEGRELDPGKLPTATTGYMRFRQLLAYDNQRLYRRGEEGTQEFVAAQVKEGELVSFTYSGNFAAGAEKAQLPQIGALTYNKNNDTFSWRFSHDAQKASEDLDQYIERCKEGQPEFEIEDFEFFADFAERVLDEVATYAGAPHFDAVRQRDALRALFIDAGCYSLSDRGGFWFAPLVDGKGPLEVARRIMDAFSAVDDANRFHLLTMPKDAQTIQTAGKVVEDGLLTRVEKVEDAMAKIAEATRRGQHKTRLSELEAVLAEARLYEEMLGMRTSDLQERISDLKDTMLAQMRAFEGHIEPVAPLEPAPAPVAPEVEPEPVQEESGPLGKRIKVDDIREAARVAKEEGGFMLVVGEHELVIEDDPVLGYRFTLWLGEEIVTEGSASTQEALVRAVRKI